MKRYKLVAVGLVFLAVAMAFYAFYSHGVLDDDARLVESILADRRVDYNNIKLGNIASEESYHNPLVYPQFQNLPGRWARMFEAWEYPKDSVPLKDNMRIVGIIDDQLNIAIIARVRGDLGFL